VVRVSFLSGRGGGVGAENPFCCSSLHTLDDAKRAHKPPPNVVSTQNVSRLRRPTGRRRATMRAMPTDAQKNMDEESVSTTDIMARLAHINFNFAICLWKYHFYGYDSYRDDLRNSIDMLEQMKTMADTIRPLHVDDALRLVRDNQLDWCIHDLTPATFQAYRHL